MLNFYRKLAQRQNLFSKKIESGFSIIELLIVFSILVIITAIAILTLGENHKISQNTARIAQIRQYQKAFDLYFSDTGYYPRLENVPTAIICLGDYPDDKCWNNGTGVLERGTIASAIVPKYLNNIHKGESIVFGRGSGTLYEGMIYIQQDYGKQYTINYFMQGNDRSCILNGTTSNNIGDDTLCTLTYR